ncbi:MAG TPA: hypothetical protein VE687_03410 [Stellaceae bacterium]|nr:hypothetical protein [Stellaceae bacterium]
MSVHLKIEDGREGFVATISQRDDIGKVIGRRSVFSVSSKEEAKQQAKTLARSLGLKVYGIIDKTDAGGSPSFPQDDPAETLGSDTDYTKTEEVRPPWSVPGAEKSL